MPGLYVKNTFPNLYGPACLKNLLCSKKPKIITTYYLSGEGGEGMVIKPAKVQGFVWGEGRIVHQDERSSGWESTPSHLH